MDVPNVLSKVILTSEPSVRAQFASEWHLSLEKQEAGLETLNWSAIGSIDPDLSLVFLPSGWPDEALVHWKFRIRGRRFYTGTPSHGRTDNVTSKAFSYWTISYKVRIEMTSLPGRTRDSIKEFGWEDETFKLNRVHSVHPWTPKLTEWVKRWSLRLFVDPNRFPHWSQENFFSWRQRGEGQMSVRIS